MKEIVPNRPFIKLMKPNMLDKLQTLFNLSCAGDESTPNTKETDAAWTLRILTDADASDDIAPQRALDDKVKTNWLANKDFIPIFVARAQKGHQSVAFDDEGLEILDSSNKEKAVCFLCYSICKLCFRLWSTNSSTRSFQWNTQVVWKRTNFRMSSSTLLTIL